MSIAEKLVKCLSLGDDLSYQLKSFLKDNQKANKYFSLTDEKRIWDNSFFKPKICIPANNKATPNQTRTRPLIGDC